MSTENLNSSLIWRKQKRTHTSRFEYILESGLFSDITFRVGLQDQVIKGHKIILITGSPVFQAMLTGKSYDEDNDGIIIQDLEPTEFKLLLKYLYTGQEPNTLNIMALYRAAKYFMVEELIEICVHKITTNLCLDNVLPTYEMAIKYNEDKLDKMCWEFICKNGNLILERAEFCTLSVEILTKIISSDQFRANDEVQVALAVYKWGKEESVRQGLKESPENVRQALLPLISLIRFPQIDPGDFSLKIAPLGEQNYNNFLQSIWSKFIINLKGLLTSDELVSILLYFNVPIASRASMPPGRFNPSPRNYMTSSTTNNFFTLKRQEAIYKDAVNLSGSKDAWYQISFQVNKAINVTSLGLFFHDLRDLLGSNCTCSAWSCSIPCCEKEDYSKDIDLKLEIRIGLLEERIGNFISESYQIGHLKGSKYVQHVLFDQPVPIKPFSPYTIRIKYLNKVFKDSVATKPTRTSTLDLLRRGLNLSENFLALHYKESEYNVPTSEGNSVDFKFFGYQMESSNFMNLINEINFSLA